MMRLRAVLLLSGVAALAACVPQAPRQQPPQQVPQPAPRPQPRPVQPVLPPPPGVDWRDLPLSQGAWFYSREAASTQAMFGPPNSEAAFIIRCDLAQRQIRLSREGTTGGSVMTIRTTSGARNYPVSVQTQPLAYIFGTTGANDRFLDDVVFSRGRFTVQVPGTSMLVLPAWPEPARVIEDCRS